MPLCTSLIADHFSQRSRGAALGVFSLGTNAGYSLAFTLGDLITRTNFYQMVSAPSAAARQACSRAPAERLSIPSREVFWLGKRLH